MPNEHNIKRPFVLVGPGRSGTSLVSNLIVKNDDVEFVGETASLIFGLWDSMEQSAAITRHITTEKNAQTTIMTRADEVIRGAFCHLYPDPKKYWFQKPIGVPKFILNNFDYVETQKSGEAYWKVLKTCFPEGKFFTILRHPFDIVLSSSSYWGWDQESIWKNISWMAKLILHNDSPVNYAIDFKNLVEDHKNQTKELCFYLGINFNDKMLEAFDHVHAADSKRPLDKNFNPSRQSYWETLDLTYAKPEYLENIQALYEKFNFSLELPPLDPKAKTPRSQNMDKDQQIDELRKVISELHHQIDRMNIEFSKRLKNQSIQFENQKLEINDNWQERVSNLGKYIEELKSGNQWLGDQIEKYSEKVEELQKYNAQLIEGNQWLSDQSKSWQDKINELEQYIAVLKADKKNHDEH